MPAKSLDSMIQHGHKNAELKLSTGEIIKNFTLIKASIGEHIEILLDGEYQKLGEKVEEILDYGYQCIFKHSNGDITTYTPNK